MDSKTRLRESLRVHPTTGDFDDPAGLRGAEGPGGPTPLTGGASNGQFDVAGRPPSRKPRLSPEGGSADHGKEIRCRLDRRF
jgi:hypothetical protein